MLGLRPTFISTLLSIWLSSACRVGLAQPNHCEEQLNSIESVYPTLSFEEWMQQGEVIYERLLAQARRAGQLYPDRDPQLERLRRILHELLPYASKWNQNNTPWMWELNIRHSQCLTVYGFGEGKLLVFGDRSQIQNLSDDEIAYLLGHHIAHLLRAHVRTHLHAVPLGEPLRITALSGLAYDPTRYASLSAQWLAARHSYTDEVEADLIGNNIAVHAGYHPNAALRLWRKLLAARRSTLKVPGLALDAHPFIPARLAILKKNLKRQWLLYAKAVDSSAHHQTEPPAPPEPKR